jgi:hypothetical protein
MQRRPGVPDRGPQVLGVITVLGLTILGVIALVIVSCS